MFGHCRNVKKGRHQAKDYSLRFCDLCLKINCYIVEDEFHFLLVCPMYHELRTLYFKDRLKHANPTIKLYYDIRSICSRTHVNSLMKYLEEAFKFREYFLKKRYHVE